jgi:hypothetical protein
VLKRVDQRLMIAPPAARLLITGGTSRVRVVTPHAARKARQREREALGLESLTIVTHGDRLIEALLISKHISERDALDRVKVERAAAAVLAEWVARWVGN